MENGEKGTIKLNIMENVDKEKILIDKRARILYKKIFPKSHEEPSWYTLDELEKIVNEFIEIVFKDIKYEKWIEFEYEDIVKCLKLFIISSVINYKSYFYGEFLSKIKSCIFIKEMIETAYEKSTRLTKWKKEIESYRILNEEKTLEQIVKIIYDILIKNTEIVCECDKVIINKNEINIIKEKVENKNLDVDDDFEDFSIYDKCDEEVDEKEKDSYHFECGLKFETSIGGIKNNYQIILVNQIERFRVYDAWYGNGENYKNIRR